VPSAGDSVVVGRQKFAGQRERVPNADAKLEMELSGEGQLQERDVRDAPCDSAALCADIRNRAV
jgi:hypothetical protein